MSNTNKRIREGKQSVFSFSLSPFATPNTIQLKVTTGYWILPNYNDSLSSSNLHILYNAVLKTTS